MSHFFVLMEETLSRIRELIGPLLTSRHAQLVELTYRYEGSRVILRFLVDTARGVTLDELSEINQAIGVILDEHDVIPQRYLLEVNSPGLDRPLRLVADFERVIGRRVKVATAVPVNFRREMTGELVGASEESIVLRLDSGEKVRIPLVEIAHAVQEVKI